MTAATHFAVPARSRWRDATRGALALVAILALVVGVPIGLAIGVGWPLPHGIPTFSEIGDALRDNYVDDSVLVKALACICWLVWIELVASLILEAAAAVQGRRAAHVPLAGGVQKMAARLVAAVLLLAVLAPGRGAPKPVHGALQLRPQGPVVMLVDDAGPGGWSSAAGSSNAPESAAANSLASTVGLPTYEVQRRDTLWDIAETHLGDPFRWPEIYELNRDVVQADGTMLTNPDLIYPGWQLRLPADAVGLPGVTPVAAPTPPPAAPTPTPPPAEPVSDQTPTPDPDVMRVIEDDNSAVVPVSAGGADAMVVVSDDGTVEAKPGDGGGRAAYEGTNR